MYCIMRNLTNLNILGNLYPMAVEIKSTTTSTTYVIMCQRQHVYNMLFTRGHE